MTGRRRGDEADLLLPPHNDITTCPEAVINKHFFLPFIIAFNAFVCDFVLVS